MGREDRSAGERFDAYVGRLGDMLGHADRREPLRAYLTGLLLPGPRKSAWSLDEHVLASEREGRIAPESHGRWKVVNRGRHNAFGQPTGYVVETHDTAEPLLKKQDTQRASFIENALWITAFDPDQRYAAGDTPNQHDILTGSQLDGTAFGGTDDTTCSNWTSSGEGSALVGHHDRQGGGANPTSWNSAHGSRGCSQDNLRGTGGDGLFYCFAVK